MLRELNPRITDPALWFETPLASQSTLRPAELYAAGLLETLLEVQDLDTVISQLRHRKATLPARQELARLSAALAAADRRAAEVEESRAALLERQRALEGDIATTTARREALVRLKALVP